MMSKDTFCPFDDIGCAPECEWFDKVAEQCIMKTLVNTLRTIKEERQGWYVIPVD